MKNKWMLGFFVTAVTFSAAAVAQAEPYENCTSAAWDEFAICSYEAGSDAGVHMLRDATAGGTVRGLQGAAAGMLGAGVSEIFEQGECAIQFTAQSMNCSNGSQATDEHRYDSDQYSEDPFPSSDYSRDTTGDGQPDQSYSGVDDADYYGYSESFSDTLRRYIDW